MNLTPEQKAIGKENFYAAIGTKVKAESSLEKTPREKLQEKIAFGLEAGGVPGYAYFNYSKSIGDPIRVGVLGTGDEGSVLINALNPEYVEVKAIADIRPYNRHRAFFGDLTKDSTFAVRCGLMEKYRWKSHDEALTHVKVFKPYQELIAEAKNLDIEAVIIALPLHLHKPAAIMAMEAGLHVLTEKLMGHSIRDCKEMARKSAETGMQLATGHQRHYNILYEQSVELIRGGLLGELHYIRAQWHRNNRPGSDSWQKPMPREAKPDDPQSRKLLGDLANRKGHLKNAKTPEERKLWQNRVDQLTEQIGDRILAKKRADGRTLAEAYGYESKKILDAAGNEVYDRPAIEELIRWRLWDRTGGGLMAELGSHQLDAASIFVAAVHGEKQYPLSVQAAANRPLFPPDRDVDDHVYCLFEFPALGFDPKDPSDAGRKKIGVQYASINGNDYGGYGEAVFGTEGTLLLERETDAMLYHTSKASNKLWVELIDRKDRRGKRPGLKIDKDKPEKGDPESTTIGQMAMKDAGRGYTEEIEHFAAVVRDPTGNPPLRCNPKVALGDAVIALTTNMAARQERRIEFKKEWFDPENGATP